MKIKFEFEVSGFLEAAEVEGLLKKHKIKYSAEVLNNVRTCKVGRRKRITKIELAAVVLSIKQNPKWDNVKIARATNVSSATVGRIRDGSHTLQRH